MFFKFLKGRNKKVDNALAIEIQQAVSDLSTFSKWRLKHGQKIFLGLETRKNWTGYSPFYLFWCQNCSRYAKDYPRGFFQNYLCCPFCETTYDF